MPYKSKAQQRMFHYLLSKGENGSLPDYVKKASELYSSPTQRKKIEYEHPDVAERLEKGELTPYEAVDIINSRLGTPTNFRRFDTYSKIRKSLGEEGSSV